MQIRSRFKDYYDHVAHLYGGGDPSIVYVRDRLAERKFISGALFSPNIHLSWKDDETFAGRHLLNYNTDYRFKWLSVAGKAYLLVSDNSYFNAPYEILDAVKHPKVCSALFKKNRGSTLADYVGISSFAVINLSKKLNTPVFCFAKGHMTEAIVESDIPILGNVGLPSILSAPQLYQNLSYFIGNTIKDSPDMMPVIPMTNKDKILSHGFDVKQSFRHRVMYE